MEKYRASNRRLVLTGTSSPLQFRRRSQWRAGPLPSDRAVRARFIVGRYALLLGTLAAGVVASLAALLVQAFAQSGCPPDVGSVAVLRWTVIVPTAILTSFCAGSATYLYRVLGTRIHVAVWATIGAVVLGLGIAQAVTITPALWCF